MAHDSSDFIYKTTKFVVFAIDLSAAVAVLRHLCNNIFSRHGIFAVQNGRIGTKSKDSCDDN